MSRTTSAWCASLIIAATALEAGCAVIPERQSSGGSAEDVAITTEIRARYASDASLSAAGIRVETQEGDVQLSGLAQSAEQRARAEEIARDVDGVDSVENDIEVQR